MDKYLEDVALETAVLSVLTLENLQSLSTITRDNATEMARKFYEEGNVSSLRTEVSSAIRAYEEVESPKAGSEQGEVRIPINTEALDNALYAFIESRNRFTFKSLSDEGIRLVCERALQCDQSKNRRSVLSAVLAYSVVTSGEYKKILTEGWAVVAVEASSASVKG